DVMQVSAKTGEGVADLLNAIVEQVPPPRGDAAAPARALIFDSVYDTYRGVVTYVRVMDGRLNRREESPTTSAGATHDTRWAGDVHRARLRVPVRVPRPAPYGDRPRAAGARVRPHADLDRPERSLPRGPRVRRRTDGHQPE